MALTAPTLEAFPCASFDQPGSVEIERMIREELSYSLEVGLVQGEALWVRDHLVAVDAWRSGRDPAVRYRWGDQVWLNVVLAVHIDYRRRGLARRLKLALIEQARQAGIVAIISIVAWTNTPMLNLNENLGASPATTSSLTSNPTRPSVAASSTYSVQNSKRSRDRRARTCSASQTQRPKESTSWPWSSDLSTRRHTLRRAQLSN